MFLRALLLLTVVGAASVVATIYFGTEVLLALGMILTQSKIVAKKLMQVELPAVVAWLKHEAALFFRVELLKKWLMTSVLPLLVGTAVLRRLKAFLQGYSAGVRRHFQALTEWFAGLEWYMKIVAGMIVLSAFIGLSVTSIGVWLILFSVKVPLWLAATVSTLVKMTWNSLRKMAFKTVAFLQLGWLWRLLRRLLPAEYLERKRRLDFRLARMVVRQRRLTLRQLAAQKDGWSMRMALLRARFRRRAPP